MEEIVFWFIVGAFRIGKHGIWEDPARPSLMRLNPKFAWAVVILSANCILISGFMSLDVRHTYPWAFVALAVFLITFFCGRLFRTK